MPRKNNKKEKINLSRSESSTETQIVQMERKLSKGNKPRLYKRMYKKYNEYELNVGHF